MERQELQYQRKRINEEYFIDPKGKVHKYKGTLHSLEYCCSLHGKISRILFPKMQQPEDYIMKQGWILVGSSVFSCPIINKKPTEAQLNKLKELDLYSKLCFLYKGKEYPNYEKYGALCE